MSNSIENGKQPMNPATLVGYALFIVFVVALGAYYLFADFRGLTNQHGIDQAQIAREISRGNHFTTKFLRPFSLYQARQKAEEMENGTVNLKEFQDTYHAPLGPLVNAAALSLAKEQLELNKERDLYAADRVIAGTGVAILLAAMLVFYLLASRIFDRKIGVLVATSMILCDMLWRFTHTGLPTVLMLFLFGFALFFLYKGVESQELERPVTGWAVLASAFFGLMALSHWIAIWIFLGALVFAALALKPRGAVAGLMGLVFLAVITPGLIRNYQITGTIHGDAFYAVYNGLGSLGESGAMRNFKPDKETLNLQGFGGRIAITSLDQLKNLVGYLGSILAAPIFFISLLHPFRRPEIGLFRWGLLAMWLFALVGMAIFGLPDGQMDANQLHILFAPVMAAYGLAMVAVLWNRYGIPLTTPLARNIPFVLLILISAVPLLVGAPRVLFRRGVFRDIPNYPPYAPRALAYLNEWTQPDEVVVTDMPWGTAWYADRLSVWMPRDINQFDDMVQFFDKKTQPVAGLYMSPVSTDRNLFTGVMEGENSSWAYYIMRPQFEVASEQVQRRERNFRYGLFMPMGRSREMGLWTNYDRSNRTPRPAPADDLSEPVGDKGKASSGAK